ncbi:MAG: hypothetical protein SGJ20_08795 [Planctomycetota bacterium]|nr:hypothetical protein [Planctomycetota bacterium]
MSNACISYSQTLVQEFGRGWNRFWFTPSDGRVLGMIRILTGLSAIWWYLSYYPDLEGWFGPDGLFSVAATEQFVGGRTYFSIFDHANTLGNLWATYWIGLVFIVLATVGFYTRIFSVLAFVWVVSLLWRAPMLSRPVDDILTMLMFYLCIGSAGAQFSLDRLLRDRKTAAGTSPQIQVREGGSSWSTVALRLIQVHTTLILVASAIAQLRGDTWWTGVALWGFIGKPESAYVDFTWIHQYPYLLNFLTLGFVIFELAFAILIWNRLARPLLLVLSLPVWVGIGLMSGMLSFTLLIFTAGLAFMPPEWLLPSRSQSVAPTVG